MAKKEKLFTTFYFKSKKDELSDELLTEFLGRSRTIKIASAYYGLNFVLNFLKQTRHPETRIQLVFNGLGGSRLESQLEDIAAINKVARRRKLRLEVRLNFAPGIFHTKLYLFKGSRARAFVGSANFSAAAFERNEELLLDASVDAVELEAYFDRIWDDSYTMEELQEEVPVASSLVSFFRQGSLFFKPTASLQLTLNPFTELLNHLTEGDRNLLGNQRLPFSEGSTGIGPFNVKTAIGFDSDLEQVPGKRFSIKSYSVETCLGYWVPYACSDVVNKKMLKASEGRKTKFRQLKRKYRKAGRDVIVQKYNTYLDAAKELFNKRNIKFNEIIDTHHLSNPFDEQWVNNLLNNIDRNLASKSFMARLINPFIESPMPEIWSDQVSYNAFRETFFEYLQMISQKFGGRTHKVPGRILSVIGVNGAVSAQEMEDKFSSFLEENEWTDESWMLS